MKIEVNAIGLVCPEPIMLLHKAIRDSGSGDLIELVASDKSTERDVEKFCELLKEPTRISDKRFLVITHNKITMGYMNKLYGITMLEPGSSKVLSVNLDQAESVFAAE